MTFEEWFTKQVGVAPVPGSFVEQAWNAAIDEAKRQLFDPDVPGSGRQVLDALKTYLNTPTSPDQGQAKGVGASSF
jgi:hypothetical protein